MTPRKKFKYLKVPCDIFYAGHKKVLQFLIVEEEGLGFQKLELRVLSNFRCFGKSLDNQLQRTIPRHTISGQLLIQYEDVG